MAKNSLPMQQMQGGGAWKEAAGEVTISGSPQSIIAALRGQGGGGGGAQFRQSGGPGGNTGGGGQTAYSPQQVLSQIRQQVHLCMQQNQAQYAAAQAHFTQQQTELQQLQTLLKAVGRQVNKPQLSGGVNTTPYMEGQPQGRRRNKNRQLQTA